MPAASDLPSDALVLFGATGDLAAGMIFPALASLLARKVVDLPVLAVGRGARSADDLATRVRPRAAGGARTPDAGLDELFRRVRFVSGDLRSPTTYALIRDALGGAQRPLHYLAIPSALFATVARALRDAGLAEGARIAIEKPFGHDLPSAQEQRREIANAFPDEAIFHVDHFLAKDPVRNFADLRATAPWIAPILSRERVRSVQITMAEAFGIGTRGRFYEATGALRDVLQNHLLRLVAVAAMEPVPVADDEAFTSSRIAAMSAIRPLASNELVYGQYDGYREEPDVAADSTVPTFVAVRLAVESRRWEGVPFLVRTGKRLALTTTMLTFDLERDEAAPFPSRVRFRLGPGAVDIAIDTHRLLPGSDSRHARLAIGAALPRDEDSDAYVNILRALVDGRRDLFERAEGVFAAWRVVDPVLAETLPVARYAPGSFGPEQADGVLPPGERWIDPEPA